MIARLEGLLRVKTPTRVLIDVNGVGYAASIPLSTFTRLPDEGKTVAVHVHTHLRDDAIQLFGFATERERSAFELLLHASRVGPKLAQTILSGIEADDLAGALRDGDVGALRAVPGVGPKMAERIVVELRDRVEGALGAGTAARTGAASQDEGARAKLHSALVNLQVSRGEADKLVEKVVDVCGEDAPIEELVRAALRRLAR